MNERTKTGNKENSEKNVILNMNTENLHYEQESEKVNNVEEENSTRAIKIISKERNNDENREKNGIFNLYAENLYYERESEKVNQVGK